MIPEPGPDEQLEIAFRGRRVAGALGLVLGAVVPWAGFDAWHRENPSAAVLVVGTAALAFSAAKVWRWAAVFVGPWLAVAYTVLLEGVMIADSGVLQWLCLAILCAINAVAMAYAMAEHRARRAAALADAAKASRRPRTASGSGASRKPKKRLARDAKPTTL